MHSRLTSAKPATGWHTCSTPWRVAIVALTAWCHTLHRATPGRARAAGLLCSQEPPPGADVLPWCRRRRTSWQTGSAGTAAWCPTPPRGAPGTPMTAPWQRRRTRCAYAHQFPPAIVTCSLHADRAWRGVSTPLRMVQNALRSGRHKEGIVQDRRCVDMQASVLNNDLLDAGIPCSSLCQVCSAL